MAGITAASQAQGYKAICAANGDKLTNVTVISGTAVPVYGVFAGGSEAEGETITITGCTFVNCSYAIGSEPAGGTTSDLEKLVVTGGDVYYTAPTMGPQDLNTYVPIIPTLPGHAITVMADHGTVTVDPKRAEAGETVTISITPDAGYQVKDITVTAVTGETIAVSNSKFVMPDCSVTVTVTFTATAPTLPFTDVDGADWFYDEVLWAYENGVMDGVGGGLFDPNGTVSRAMVWTVLARMDGAVITGSNWIQESRAWAMAEGVSDGTMATDPVTREQLATMLYRYAKAQGWDVSVGEETNLLSYPDAAQVSDWAMEAMQWACGAGVVNGMDGKLNPKGSATRAQLATMLMRFDSNKM